MKFDNNSISDNASGFSSIVTKGIAAAIPIISKIVCIIDKKIIIRKTIFFLKSKNCQKVLKINIYKFNI